MLDEISYSVATDWSVCAPKHRRIGDDPMAVVGGSGVSSHRSSPGYYGQPP
jgi:hypothetical protein